MWSELVKTSGGKSLTLSFSFLSLRHNINLKYRKRFLDFTSINTPHKLITQEKRIQQCIYPSSKLAFQIYKRNKLCIFNIFRLTRCE